MAFDFEDFIRSPSLLLLLACGALLHLIGTALLFHRVRKARSTQRCERRQFLCCRLFLTPEAKLR
jgi:hypothetical protein